LKLTKKETIQRGKGRAFDLAVQNYQLLSEQSIFNDKLGFGFSKINYGSGNPGSFVRFSPGYKSLLDYRVNSVCSSDSKFERNYTNPTCRN